MSRRDNDKRDRQRAEFGRWLQETRQRAGYSSQKEFAGLLNVTDVQMSRIETGASGVSAETLNIAIDLLKLNPLEAYKKAGLLPELTINTVEDALDVTSFFDQKGLQEEDRKAIRPLLEGIDRMIELIKGRDIKITNLEKMEDLEFLGSPHAVREEEN